MNMRKEDVVFRVNPFGPVLDRILDHGQRISHLLTSLAIAASPFGSQIKDDFKTIEESLELLILKTQDLYDLPSDSQKTSQDWKKYRHDLRALVGSIKGYAELILEEIAPHPYTGSFQEVISISDTILPLIEKLREEESKEILSEDGDKTPYTTTNPGRILIIDDNAPKRELIARRLVSVGHEVLHAENGFQGLETAQKESVDLILLDILMPGMSGYEVLRHLKKDPGTRDIPVLVISSVSELDSVVECITYGADDYLPTPVNPVLLYARINACLERKHLQDREKSARDELALAWKRLDTAIESIDEGFAIFDEGEQLILCNKPFRDIFMLGEEACKEGLTYEAFLRKNLKEGLYQEERRKTGQRFTPDLLSNEETWITERLRTFREGDTTLLQHFTSGYWYEMIENKMSDGGTVMIFKNVTTRVEQQKYMHFLAHHDALTGLANRSLFEKALRKALETGKSFGLVFLDLDGFKGINDTYGHDYGDLLLQEMGRRLTGALRDTDLVARIGGDEFVVLLDGVDTYEGLQELSERILKAVGSEVIFDGILSSFGVSLGCALYPQDATTRKSLLNLADQAMYEAKKTGKGCFFLARNLQK